MKFFWSSDLKIRESELLSMPDIIVVPRILWLMLMGQLGSVVVYEVLTLTVQYAGALYSPTEKVGKHNPHDARLLSNLYEYMQPTGIKSGQITFSQPR